MRRTSFLTQYRSLLAMTACTLMGSVLVACQSDTTFTGSQSTTTTAGGVQEQGTATNPASAGDVLSGLQFWDSTGTLQTGTLASQALNAQSTFSSGYYTSITNTPSASQIASGSTILGVAGTADFGTFTNSNIFRTVGTTPITLQAEVTTYAGSGSTPTLLTGYRAISDVTKDDDGLNDSDWDPGCSSDGTGCTSVLPITSTQHAAFVDCGFSKTSITAAIADCATQNGATATWNGSTNGNSGEATWKLVTHDGANEEVWQDQRTGLIWSSLVTTSDNWCRASGNAQSNDPYGYCDNTTVATGNSSGTVYQTYYPQAQSYCAESGTIPANAAEATGTTAGNGWSGTYAASKGGMGASATSAVETPHAS
jgi:hypothetical protein